MSSITTPITPQVALEPGTEAPDIRLPSTPDQLVSLHEFRGRNVILVFYPADWSPVCGDQTALYDELLPEFHRFNAELLGISVDGPWCHLAFAKDRKLRFPLLADFEPKGAVVSDSKALLDVSFDHCQIRLMKQNGGRKKPKAKVIREKRPAARPAKRPTMVPLPAAWEAR